MNDAERKNWKKTRAKGFNHFVVKCTLLFGILMPIFQSISEYIFDEKINTRFIGWRLIGYSIIGFLYGWWTYEWNEYKYKKTINKDE
jgi:hypothetical protein